MKFIYALYTLYFIQDFFICLNVDYESLHVVRCIIFHLWHHSDTWIKVSVFEAFHIPKFFIKDVHSKFIFSHKANSFLNQIRFGIHPINYSHNKTGGRKHGFKYRQINTAKVMTGTIVCFYCFWSTCSQTLTLVSIIHQLEKQAYIILDALWGILFSNTEFF